MSQLDDAQLAEHLARRAAGAASATELARAIEQATASTSQERPRAWERFLPSGAPSRRGAVFPALSAALGVVVLLAAANLVRAPSGQPQPSPRSTTVSTWLLDLAQLEQVLERIDNGSSSVGSVIVASVTIEKVYLGSQVASPGVDPPFAHACAVDLAPGASDPYNGECPYSYVVRGSGPAITVLGVPPTAPCDSGRCPTDALPGPFALGLHVGHVVQYISPVRLHAGGAVPWTVDEFIDSSSTEPMVVDGWLSGIGALPCPLDPRLPNGFECGPASWVTSQPFDPNVTPGPSSDGFGFQGPSRGIRVENGTSSIIGAPGVLPSGGAASQPRHGLYLLNRLAIDPAQCFLCSSGTAFVAAEVQPLDVIGAEQGPEATPLASPEPSTESGWLMDEPTLAGAVRAAAGIGGAGRVVIADVTFERAGDCAGEPIDLTACYVVVSGSNPPIRVRDTAGYCTGPFFCPAEIPPVVPVDAGPYALEILDDGSVSFVGYVDRATRVADDPSPAWGFDDLRTHLGQVSGTTLGDYQLFVVDAWISASAGIPKCLEGSEPDPRFGCGQAAWLTGGAVQPNAFDANSWSLTPPSTSIRLQNGAVPLDTEAHLVTGDSQAEHGTFLVRAVLPPLTSCFGCDGPAAELVAWLDPPNGLVSTQP